MKIVLTGKVISKKNSKKVGVNKYTHRLYVSTSNAWKEFEADALRQLEEYRKLDHFEGKVCIDYIFYYQGKSWLDVDNAITGINDLLQSSGIIRNDRDIKRGTFDIVEGCEEWKTELHIRYV